MRVSNARAMQCDSTVLVVPIARESVLSSKSTRFGCKDDGEDSDRDFDHDEYP